MAKFLLATATGPVNFGPLMPNAHTAPTATVTAKPTATRTTKPTATRTAKPTATRTAKPTATRTAKPTATRTAKPTATRTAKPTPTPTPTPVATPTSSRISAAEKAVGVELQGFEASGKTLWTSNETWLRRLLQQFHDTPELLQAFKTSTVHALIAKQFDNAVLQIAGANFVAVPEDAEIPPTFSPKIRSGFSMLALDLHNFETNSAYGDTKDELPRANCDFTSNPKGACTPTANTLAIRFNDPAIGKNLTTFFDWTGAITGNSSPTVLAHDPLNPGTIIELPTRVVWQLQSNGTVLLRAVIDIRWPASPCVSGKFLFDVPESADVTGFIIGADLVTKILDGTASASISSDSGTAAGNAAASGGGKSITANARASFSGTRILSSGSCGAFENFDLSGLTASGSASNGPNTFELGLTGTNVVTDPNGYPATRKPRWALCSRRSFRHVFRNYGPNPAGQSSGPSCDNHLLRREHQRPGRLHTHVLRQASVAIAGSQFYTRSIPC